MKTQKRASLRTWLQRPDATACCRLWRRWGASGLTRGACGRGLREVPAYGGSSAWGGVRAPAAFPGQLWAGGDGRAGEGSLLRK